jgi:hypothetical protein
MIEEIGIVINTDKMIEEEISQVRRQRKIRMAIMIKTS